MSSIANGESGLSCRTKLNTLLGGNFGNVPIIHTPSAITDITDSVGIVVTSYIQRIQSVTAGQCDISANPQIAAGTDGQIVILVGESDTKNVLLEDGNGLQLSSEVSFTLGKGDTLQLYYDSTAALWREISRSDN